MPPERPSCNSGHAAVLACAGALAGCSPAAAPPPERAGAGLYNGNCVACHQQDAHGIPGVYPSLAGSPVVLGDPAAFALWVVKGRRPDSMPAGRYATAMPQFGWMKDVDVAALLTYLRTSFGNSAPPVAPAMLSRVLEEQRLSAARVPTTGIHRMVERCRAGDYPALVTKLGSGWVVMGDRQVFAGYCLVLPDPVVDHLNVLEAAERRQFLADMAATGDAVLACTGAVRINYAMFGNAEPALHAHVIPRRADEPESIRTTQPWALDWNAAAEYSEAQHGDLKRRIAAHLNKRVRGAP